MTKLDNGVTIEEGVFIKLNNEIKIADFLKAVNTTKSEVWLESEQGDRYNLKSTLSRYIAFGALIENHGTELTIFCANSNDEHLFYNFFDKHPEAL